MSTTDIVIDNLKKEIDRSNLPSPAKVLIKLALNDWSRHLEINSGSLKELRCRMNWCKWCTDRTTCEDKENIPIVRLPQ